MSLYYFVGDLFPDDSLVICEVRNASLNDEDRFHGPIMSQYSILFVGLLAGSLGYHQQPQIGGNNYTTASWKTFFSNALFFDGLRPFI